MTSRQLFISFLIVISFSCKSKSSGGAAEETGETAAADQNTTTADKPISSAKPVEPGVAADFLAGKWASDCINGLEGAIQASRIVQYEFAVDGTASFKELSYRGINCTLRYTKPDVDTLKLQLNADRAAAGQSPLTPEELASLDNLWFPQPSAFKFKLGRKLKDDTIEIDTTTKVRDLASADKTATKDVSTYLVLYIEENILYFALTCNQSDFDSGLCTKIVGQIPTDRGRDLRESPPFHKI